MTANRALRTWQQLQGSAAGRWLFTRIVCLRAPYFASISPQFLELGPGRARARIRKRRKVQNHLGTVHAIAMANLCELVAGTVTEVSIPGGQRWIPKGMNIAYLAKAGSDVTATATLPPLTFGEPQDVVVNVEVRDSDGQEVVHAEIRMYVSPRPQRSASSR